MVTDTAPYRYPAYHAADDTPEKVDYDRLGAWWGNFAMHELPDYTAKATGYWWAMVLLGVGWNLLFVAGTSLLTTTYRPGERFRAQAVNEFSVFGTQALASLLAGPAIHALGWRTLNLATLVPLALFAVALLAWPGQRSRNSRA